MGLLLKSVEATCETLASNKPIVLPCASLRALLEHRSQKQAAEEELHFREEYAGVNEIRFPTIGDERLAHPQAIQFLQRKFSIPKDMPSRPCYNTANLVRAAWAIVFATNVEATDVTYRTSLANRSAPVEEIENIVGPVLAKLPVRVRFDPDTTVLKFLESTREQSMSMASRGCSLGIHQIAALDETCAAACRFQTMFVVHPPETSRIFEDRIGMRKIQVNGFHPHELVVEAMLGADGEDTLTLQASWDQRALTRPRAIILLGQLERFMRELSDETKADVPASEIELF
jgi:hypothetical protein